MIPRESSSSGVIKRHVKYHVAALKADPQTAHLEPRITELGEQLNAAAQAQEDAETTLMQARALHDRADLDLDTEIRKGELACLEAVSKDREAPAYRAVFPNGLSAVLAGSGAEQQRVVNLSTKALREHLPQVAERYSSSWERLAQAAVGTEAQSEAAEDAEAQTRVAEVLARGRVREQLYRNRGALETVYPGDRRRVRSFFIPSRRSSGKDDEEETKE